MLAWIRSGTLLALGGMGCTLTTPLDELQGSGGSGTGAASSSSSAATSSNASSTATSASVTSSSTASGDPCASPLFTDDFASGLDGWQIDSGQWIVGNTDALEQQDELSGSPTIYVPAFPTLADHRLRATVAAISGSPYGAVQLVARIDPNNHGNRYWCAWQPWDGWLIIRVEANYLTVNDPVAFQVNLSQTPDYSPTAPRIMHFEVVGTMLHCWVEGVVGADATTSDGTYTQGAFGLKTYLQRAAFDDVTACP